MSSNHDRWMMFFRRAMPETKNATDACAVADLALVMSPAPKPPDLTQTLKILEAGLEKMRAQMPARIVAML